nr:MAG TPA: hypothetical protein [Caudoviricetes sp.]
MIINYLNYIYYVYNLCITNILNSSNVFPY